jgi:predicted lipid-binding transport protein (Tim44 family)
MLRLSRRLKTFAAVALLGGAAGLLTATIADARPGRGGSIGSRGGQTFSTPPTTPTAPKAAQPIDRTMTQPGTQAKAPAPGAQANPAMAPQRPSMMRNLLLGGLIGAALFGLFGSAAPVLGFVLQMLLFAGLAYLAFAFSRARRQPALGPAGYTPHASRASGNGGRGRIDLNNIGRQAYANADTGRGRAGGQPPSQPIQILPADYDAFERLLGEIQTRYGRRDVKGLERLVTPEMLSYFAAELAENDKRGVVNEVSQPKLLQGDLAEAWREPTAEYATVAMRYAIVDATVETASGRVIDGDRTRPIEVTEVWTFTRPPAGKAQDWELSAIQQV